MGIKETASTFHISRNTVRKYVRMFIASGKGTEQLLTLSEEHLRELLGIKETRKREISQRRMELEALIPEYASRLSRKEQHCLFHYALVGKYNPMFSHSHVIQKYILRPNIICSRSF